MARFKFGGTSGDFVAEVGPGGVLHALPAQLTVWTAESGGTRLTDLLWGDQAAMSIPVAAGGQIPTFEGPDGVAELWADAGTGGRTRLLTQVPDVPAAVAAAQSAAATSGTQAARAEQAAAEAEARVVNDLGTTDEQSEALIKAPTSKTAAALSATVVSESGGALLRSGLGTSDDTGTIQAALDSPFVRKLAIGAAAAGVALAAVIVGTVNVPAGKTLHLHEGASIVRGGSDPAAPVRLAAGASLTGTGTVDGSSLTNFVIGLDGDRSSVSGVTVINSLNGVGSGGANDISVAGVHFKNLTGYTTLLEGNCARPSYRDNTGENVAQGFIAKGNSSGGVVTGNTLKLAGGDSVSSVGIELFGSGIKTFTVAGNTVYGVSHIGISVAAAQTCTVTGNTVVGAELGIENAEGASGNTIVGNTVGPSASTTKGVGIGVTTSDPTNRPLRAVTVAGNTIIGMVQTGIESNAGAGLAITGNTFRNCATAIWCQEGSTGGSVSENTIYSDLPTYVIGIRVKGKNLRVSNNAMYVTTVLAQSRGLSVEGGEGGHRVFDNVFTNVEGGIEHNNAGGCVYDNNSTVGTTGFAMNLYGAATSTTRVLTHHATTTTGELFFNSGGAKFGPSVSNAMPASTLGALSKKIEVFDAKGVSIGFVPVYGSIS